MVDSTLTDDDRRVWDRVLGTGFVLLVAGSAGLIALQGGATPVEIAAVTGFGLVTGIGLVWYLASLRRPGRGSGRRRL